MAYNARAGLFRGPGEPSTGALCLFEDGHASRVQGLVWQLVSVGWAYGRGLAKSSRTAIKWRSPERERGRHASLPEPAVRGAGPVRKPRDGRCAARVVTVWPSCSRPQPFLFGFLAPPLPRGRQLLG